MRARTALIASAGVLSLIGAVVLPGGASKRAVAQPMSAQLMAATPIAHTSDGSGYWLVTADGRVFAFGGAHLYGSMAGRHLKGPIIGIVATADNHGYWLVGSDGGVFSFGDAKFSGSLGSTTLGGSVVGMDSLNAANAMNGARGPAGPAGPRGAAGSSGATGSNGGVGPTGSNGLNGAAGATGSNGSNGSNGAVGPTGSNGLNGAAGATGSNGSNGSNGAAGATGATGAAGGLQGYGYVFNTGAQTVAIEAAVSFDHNGPLLGATHAPGNAGVAVTSAGTYSVNFSVSGVEPGQFSVFVNGAASANTVYGSGAGTQQDLGQTFLTLSAGDVITLVNHSSAAAVTLQTLAGGTQTNVNASVAIMRLG